MEACALIGDGDDILFVLPELCGVQICPQVDYRLHRFWINRVKAVGSGAVHNDSFSVFQINCVQGIGVGGAVVYFLGFIGKGSGYFFHQCGFSASALSHNGNKFALFNRERNIVNRMDKIFTASVGFCKIFNFQNFHKIYLQIHFTPIL